MPAAPDDPESPALRPGRAPRRAAPGLLLLAGGVALSIGIAIGWSARGVLSATGIPAHRFEERLSRGTAPPSMSEHVERTDDADETARFWSALAWSLAARSRDLEGALEALQSESDDPRRSLERAIAASSDAELAAIVSAITRIDEEELLASEDLRPFASRLVDVALDGLDGPSSEPPPERRVLFAETTRDFDPDESAREAFPADQGRIFAMVELNQHRGGRVMVKWLNTETGRIHSLQSMPHDASRPLWSYLGRNDDWDPGRYEVSFYTQDAEMRLLGRGEFTVFDPRERS